MTPLSPIAEIARAARDGDLAAINAVLDAMTGDKAAEVVRGRFAAVQSAPAEPLPPLPVDSLAMIAAEAAPRGGYLAPRFPKDRRA